MRNFYQRHKRLLQDVLIVLLSVAFIASLVWFVASFDQTYQAGDLRPEYRPRKAAAIRQAVPAITVDSVQSWMTFEYLTVVFKLPPTYLKEALAVTDPRYPNIRMDTYTREMHTDTAFFLQNVKKALTSYSYGQH